MPKKQKTAAKKARAATRQDGTKYTIALRDAAAGGPAPEFATATRVAAILTGQAWQVRALGDDGQVLAEWPIELPAADHGHVDRWLARHSVRRTDQWPKGPLVDGADVPITHADSPAAALAFVEANFVPADVDRPCRCSGRGEDGACHHGTVCGDDECTPDGQPCKGRLVHVDRFPGATWAVTVWEDTYECSASDEETTGSATLPELPWGRVDKPGVPSSTIIFDDVHHPLFDDVDFGRTGCGECGADTTNGYRCNCPELCDECGGDLDSGYGCHCGEPYDEEPSASGTAAQDEPDDDDYHDDDDYPEQDLADYYAEDGAE